MSGWASHAPKLGRRRAFRCPCKCGTIGFCESHLARLAEIRAEMEGTLLAKGTYAQRRDQRKYTRGRMMLGPTCTTEGCFEPRVSPSAFCEGCMEAGG